MKRKKRLNAISYVLLFIVLIAGCGSPPPLGMPSAAIPTPITGEAALAPLSGSGEGGERTLLTYDDLMAGFDAQSPLDEAAFALPEDAASADHHFEGRLELVGEADIGDVKFLRGGESWTTEEKHLPDFDFEFVQAGSYLVPVQRGADHNHTSHLELYPRTGTYLAGKRRSGICACFFPFCTDTRKAAMPSSTV